MEKITRFKLRKVKKRWLTVSVSAAVLIAALASTGSVLADESPIGAQEAAYSDRNPAGHSQDASASLSLPDSAARDQTISQVPDSQERAAEASNKQDISASSLQEETQADLQDQEAGQGSDLAAQTQSEPEKAQIQANQTGESELMHGQKEDQTTAEQQEDRDEQKLKEAEPKEGPAAEETAKPDAAPADLQTEPADTHQGFVSDEAGNWYYYDQEGKKVTGWQEIDGQRYYFDQDGKQFKGQPFVEPGGYIAHKPPYYDRNSNIQFEQVNRIFYFDPDTGEMWKNRFVYTSYVDPRFQIETRREGWFYLGDDGQAVIGWQTIDGKRLYFTTTGVQIKDKLINNDGAFDVGYRTEDDRYFLDPDTGEVWTNRFVHASYERLHSRGLFPTSNWFYLGPDGKAVTGWQTIDGKEYHFDYMGAQSKGKTAWQAGKLFYLDDLTGEKVYNSFEQVSEAGNDGPGSYLIRSYYFGPDGSRQDLTGLKTIDGKTYFFNDNHSLLIDQVQTIDGQIYGFDEKGELKRNSFAHANRDYKTWYYLGEDGKAVKGWQTIDGFRYYFLENGVQAKDKLVEVGDSLYYFDKDSGQLWTNRQLRKDGFIYQIGADGRALDITDQKTRFETQADGKTYFIDENGQKATGLQDIKGNKYYFDTDGVLQKNFLLGLDENQQVIDASSSSNRSNPFNTFYYFDAESGAAVKNKLEKIGDDLFYFGEEGMVRSGDRPRVGDKIYYSNWDRTISIKEGITSDRYPNFYFIQKDGSISKNRFVTDGQKTYYMGEDGHPIASGYQTIDDQLYYFTATGLLAKGLQVDDQAQLFQADPETGIIQKDAIKPHQFYSLNSGKDVYYTDADGKPVKGWQEIDGQRYYFDTQDSRMAKGWVEWIDGAYRAFDAENGQLKTSGFFTLYNSSFYADPEGRVLLGWQTIDGKKLYFKPNYKGAQIKGNFALIEGKLYYFDPETGELWTNRTLEIGKSKYEIDENGYVTKLT